MTTLTDTYTVGNGSNTLTISVKAIPGTEPGSLDIEVSPVAVPRGPWNLVWELQGANFTSVDLPADPLRSENVHITNSQGGGTQWSAQLDNGVKSINGFNYTINVESATGSPSASGSIDPTIAVTPDPPPGG